MSPRLPKNVSILLCALLVLCPSLAQGYGYAVHRIVNRAATTHLPAAFQGFARWADELEDLSTAADERKGSTPGESIKHYIDIDDYPEFFTGTLPVEYEDMVAMYGQSRVDGNGIAPWAIEASYDDLVIHFQNQDWEAAVASAADLGHYVADTHNPMHLTLNYNGQLTDQYGIHSRHESEMTSRHLAELVPSPGQVSQISSPLAAAYDWIRYNYQGVEMILEADLVAKAAAGGSTSSDTYYDRLWQEVGDETTVWIREASLALASLWYAAWLEAGSPPLPGDVTDTHPPLARSRTRVLANVPNPFNPTTALRFQLGQAGPAVLRIVDAAGRSVLVTQFAYLDAGIHEYRWNGTDTEGRRVASGVYRVLLTDESGVTATGSAVMVK